MVFAEVSSVRAGCGAIASAVTLTPFNVLLVRHNSLKNTCCTHALRKYHARTVQDTLVNNTFVSLQAKLLLCRVAATSYPQYLECVMRNKDILVPVAM